MWRLLLVFAVIAVGDLSAQQISREVYPTELELSEAFSAGDIEIEEYLLLL